MGQIKELQDKVHATAVRKGFWDMSKSFENNPTLNEDEKFAIKQAFQGQRLMLVTSELSEGLEYLRKKDAEPLSDEIKKLIETSEGQDYVDNFLKFGKDSYADELADAFIRLLDISGGEGIDLEWHVLAKMRYNDTRAKMHGKTF